MDQPRESIFARLNLAAIGGLLNRYLTPISIGVLALGVLAVALGPGRMLINSNAPATSSGGGGGQAGGALDGSDKVTIDRLNRSLVPFTIIPDRPRKDVMSYTIRAGDTLSGIANEFGISPETIFWSNKATLRDDVHLIFPGITIAIMPTDGVYYISDGTKSISQIAADYKVTPEDIINSIYNNLAGATPDQVPAWGSPVVVPGGTSVIVSWAPPITATIDAKTGNAVYGFMQGMAGSCASGIQGGGGTGAWISPVGSYTVTTPFASYHSGIDLGAVLGTAVGAADTGVVIYAGWVPDSWGYGQLVVLDHGNGWTTYYAHLNSISARCGQTIGRGGTLGGVGSTGRSTGSHLHFEMRWNHTPDNPAAYIGF